MVKFNETEENNCGTQECTDRGGRTTISPPAKISQEDCSPLKILASNIDTLRLSVDIEWKDSHFFSTLTEGKILANQGKVDIPVSFILDDEKEEYFLNVKSHGSQGYEWILNNPEYSLLIGNWPQPQSRPSAMITIRSETLWRKGPRHAVHFITKFLENVGAKIIHMKISRLDLCLDALVPNELWNANILDYRVTRASATHLFYSDKKLSGFMIGKGIISARLYDKPLEIKQQSQKNWFFDIWGLKAVPEGHKVIRAEFQLRREALKELGVDHVHNVFDLAQHIWNYCTKEWLKFQDNPGKQSVQRETLDWWKLIQDGFNNIPAGAPLIRSKALKANKDALSQQILGLLSSFAAVELETGFNIHPNNINLISAFQAFRRHSITNNLSDIPFSEKVENKKAKYQRLNNKKMESHYLRKQLGFASLSPIWGN